MVNVAGGFASETGFGLKSAEASIAYQLNEVFEKPALDPTPSSRA
jgi:hypothetical protein